MLSPTLKITTQKAWMQSLQEFFVKKQATDVVKLTPAQEKDPLQLLLGGSQAAIAMPLSAVPIELADELCIAALPYRLAIGYNLLRKHQKLDTAQPFGLSAGSHLLVPNAALISLMHALCPQLRVTSLAELEQAFLHPAHTPHDALLLPKTINLPDTKQDLFSPFHTHPSEVIPPPGQATLAFLCRKDDLSVRRQLYSWHDTHISACTNIERGIQRLVMQQTPDRKLLAYCEIDANKNYHVSAAITFATAPHINQVRLSSSTSHQLAERVYDQLLKGHTALKKA